MSNLDISKIPARFVYFWWLSKVIKYFDDLIISPEQVYLFSAFNNQMWDQYRDHWILVKAKISDTYKNPFLTEEYRNKTGCVSIRDYLRAKDNRLLNIKSI